MTNTTQQEPNDVKLVKLIPDLSGMATKLFDYYEEREMREVTVKHIKRMLDDFKNALKKLDKNYPEADWFYEILPSVKKSLTTCSRRKVSKNDLNVHADFIAKECRNVQDLAAKIDAE